MDRTWTIIGVNDSSTPSEILGEEDPKPQFPHRNDKFGPPPRPEASRIGPWPRQARARVAGPKRPATLASEDFSPHRRL
ncbi:hypothetical protein ACFX2I_026541 [Malus domestica]